MKTLNGLLLAPPSVALPVTGFAALSWMLSLGSDASSALVRLLALYLVASILASYILTCIIGIPAHVVLQRFGRRTLTAYVLTGLLLVLAPLGAYFTYVVAYEGRQGAVAQSVARNGPEFARAGALLGACGATVAGVFWAVAVRPQPPQKQLG